VLLALAAGVAAQQATAPTAQQPLFRTKVDLVTVDVRAVDKDGKPVPGLTKDDFVVTLEGERRPVMVLDYQVYGGGAATGAREAPAGSVSNDAATVGTASRGGRVFLLVIDDLSAQPLQMKGLLISAEKMLATLGESDLVGLVTTSGLGPAISPTRDRAQLTAALRSKDIMGRADPPLTTPYVTVKEAFDIARPAGDRDTMAAVFARECGGAPSTGGSSVRGRRDGRLVAGAFLSVASLPPGIYQVTATVLSGAETVGAVSAHLRKPQ
jgi:VWFA-related protein